MSLLRFSFLLSLPLLLTAAMCEPDEAQEIAPPASAAERLQQPRNIYKGNINENLKELQIDLEETMGERKERQDQAIDDALGR